MLEEFQMQYFIAFSKNMYNKSLLIQQPITVITTWVCWPKCLCFSSSWKAGPWHFWSDFGPGPAAERRMLERTAEPCPSPHPETEEHFVRVTSGISAASSKNLCNVYDKRLIERCGVSNRLPKIDHPVSDGSIPLTWANRNYSTTTCSNLKHLLD